MSGLKVHHLNCASMCPVGASLMNRERFVCHCLLVETDAGLVLVDTGMGLKDVTGQHKLPFSFTAALRPALVREETALEQIQDLGYAPDDVRHIVVTHLDIDHAGGLPDFPNAAIHVHGREKAAALGDLSFEEKLRYRAVLWAHQPDWHSYDPTGEPWHGFEAVRDLDGLPPEILLIPLHGHSRGHSGVAIESTDGWLLHAGDAYFHHDDIHADSSPWLAGAFQRFMSVDEAARLENQRRLRQLAEGGAVDIFCAHDAHEFDGRQHKPVSAETAAR